MALPIPPYILEAKIVDTELRYPWDEWDIRRHWDVIDESLFQRLDKLTNRAATALTIASAEWVCHRYSALNRDPLPMQYLEAAWAANIDTAYCEFLVTEDDDWRGLVRSALNVTIVIVNDALFHLGDEPQAAIRTCWMHALANHVLPKTEAFNSWFERCLQRLEQHYPRSAAIDDLFDEVEGMGSPVPREAFDPDLEWDLSDAAHQLDRFLAQLRPDTNEFLREPEEIEDYVETPYRYLEADEPGG